MSTFCSAHHLTSIIASASSHCSGLASDLIANQYRARLQPVVLAEYEFLMTIPAFGSNSEISIKRVRYCRKYITPFLGTTEYLGEEGKGMYGIGLYREGAAPRWSCDSILFDENGAPILIKGREAAFEIAIKEAQLHDKSNASENEKTILAHSLMEASVLNALLGALIRAEPETTPAAIGVRFGTVQLLLADDEDGGRSIRVPNAKFLCRDDAAAAVLQEIAYAADDARRAQPVPARKERVCSFKLLPT